jgi:hypothetical protein
VYPFADEPASNKRSGHDDEDLVQITANELAVQREAHDGRAACAPVAASPIAQRDPRDPGKEQDQPEG